MNFKKGTHIIANDPGGRMAYAQRFMEVKGLHPHPVIHDHSKASLKENYHHETGHNLHPVTSQNIDTARAKGNEAFAPMTQSNNRQLRQETGATIQTRQKEISDNEKQKSRNTSPIVQEVQNEQGKSVVKRVSQKAWKEILHMGGEILQEVKEIGKEMIGIGPKKKKD